MVPALLFGILLPFVARMNETLSRLLGPLTGAWAVHAVGGVFGALFLLPFLPTTWVGAARTVPWWAWLGGVLGTGMVVLANASITRLGTAGFIAFSVASQLAASALLDHIGFPDGVTHPFTLLRAGGILLLSVGAVMVVRG
jgi:transporter family-2 protein